MREQSWQKSSYSSDQGGACVEVASFETGHRAVRDSKDPTGPALRVSGAQWAAFTVAVGAGEFD